MKKDLDISEFIGKGSAGRLPDKLSDLLEIAIQDAQLAQCVRGMKLNMNYYVNANFDDCQEKNNYSRCEVCLAGASLVHQLGIVNLLDCGGQVMRKLQSIDHMRCGRFLNAYECLEIYKKDSDFKRLFLKLQSIVKNRFLDSKHGGKYRAPWETYRRCIRILRENGL